VVFNVKWFAVVRQANLFPKQEGSVFGEKMAGKHLVCCRNGKATNPNPLNWQIECYPFPKDKSVG